jgi:sugar/nucleoside kinase (ribokinase family)
MKGDRRRIDRETRGCHPRPWAVPARAGRTLLERGPRLAALAVGEQGNVFVWLEGELVLPVSDVPVVDTTGAGDAFTAALTLTLARATAGHAGAAGAARADGCAEVAARDGSVRSMADVCPVSGAGSPAS